MTWSNRVVWLEGMFLRAQHFQQQDRWLEALVRDRTAALRPHGWGLTEGAIKMAVCRLRERYRGRLKEEIAHTVASPAEVDEELRHLFRVLARG